MSRQVGNCSICKQVCVITSQRLVLFATLDIINLSRSRGSRLSCSHEGRQEAESQEHQLD